MKKHKQELPDTYYARGENLRMNVEGMTANRGETLQCHYAQLALDSGLTAETVASLENGRAAQVERFHHAFRLSSILRAEIMPTETV